MDISSYVEGNKLKIEQEERRRLDFYKEAREKAEKVANALRYSFPDIEVYLFGSQVLEEEKGSVRGSDLMACAGYLHHLFYGLRVDF